MCTYYMIFVLGIVLGCITMIESNNKQSQFRNKRSMSYATKNNDTVYYTIDSKFSTSQKNYILQQIAKFNKYCEIWFPSVPDKMVSVHFTPNETSCFTHMKGRTGTSIVNLADRCFDQGWVMHEMGHALGFQHEHQRSDRDCYVEVDPSVSSNRNYAILTIETTYPYDWTSFMHYRRGTTLRLRPEFYQYQFDQLGTYDALSPMDVNKLNFYFCRRGRHYCLINMDVCKKAQEFVKSKKCSK
ncbi:hatching enzyme 1.2-like [Homalodisca vitripennis]|uniref:hatching enzyme 1.2-like n=1 Tax=Homalodisca vitripennis TaxID=197043 RepID=UPI001EEA0335|nr:hatching enzyme 1.2-like [Homalodisca vitripennis]